MYQLIAICPEETKAVTVQELKDLGATNIIPEYMAVSFDADEALFYKAHLYLATASSILRVLRVSNVRDSEYVFHQSKKIRWEKIFSLQKTYRVDGVAGDRGSDAMTSNEISKQVRRGIEDTFQYKLGAGKIPRVELKEPDVIITAYMHRNRLTVSVLTSGKAMHKRGYRLPGHPAPVKETVAASLLKLAGYDGTQALFDPMCGSGTIPIEAAFMALHKAPLIHRKKDEFGFEHLLDFNRDLWRSVQEEARKDKTDELKAPIFAMDIDPEYVKLAQAIALRGRVEKFIQFEAKDFFESEKPADTGILLTNMPYGERIGEKEALAFEDFYKRVGDHLKKNFTGWRACLFVNDKSPWKFIGLKPSKKVSLLNGSIHTKLLIFDLYAGSKR